MIYWAIKVKNNNKKFFREESGLGHFISDVPSLFKTKDEVDNLLSSIEELSDIMEIESYSISELKICQITIN
jgi:hypothetical protein